ncbi:unnamed protein product [Timema podura]|uniref:Microtubule-associated protein 1A/B/S-like MBL-like domain-containing protein n=1 Tax=Timema podura TaxID=61482 RepID=A0ABN7NPD1_TIMPD|nr:unnamed protein product [Timema podura]
MRVRVNPDDRLTAGGPAISSFLDYINPFLIPASLEQLLEPSDVVGNIRFSHPTLYVFPGGQGDAALFGINGFNMLVDGGFNRKACFWDFARHLDRLDAVLVTRLNNGNVNGISAVLRRKKQSHVLSADRAFLLHQRNNYGINRIDERRHAASPDGDKDRDPLLINLLDEGQELVILFPGSTPQHKIFEGLDKIRHLEFLKYPVCSVKSISPSASTVTMASRAGIKHKSTPAVLDKIIPGEGIIKTPSKSLEINKQQVAKSATIPVTGGQTEEKKTKPSTPVSTLTTPTTTKAPPQAKVKIEKATSKTEPPKMKTESNKPIEGEKVKVEKSTKPTPDSKPKEHKSKIDSKSSTAKSRIDSKPPRSLERKSQKISTTTPVGEKKAEVKSSPTTPKKSVESKVNGVASKAEISKVSRAASKSRQSPSTTPAKSTKEANNRKVVESKYNVSRTASTSRAPTPKSTKKEPDNTSTTVKSERKPISRRPKPASPSKTGKSPSSPAKSSSAKSTPTPSVKSEKDGVIRKVRGEPDKVATDSSAVSTPSTAEPETGPLKVKVLPVEETPAFAESKHINETVQDKILSADVENLNLEKPKHTNEIKEYSDAVEATSISGTIKAEEFGGKQGDDVNDNTETEEVIEETKISPKVLGTTSQEETEDEDVTEDKELVALGEDEHDERQDVEITEEERTEDIEDEDIVIEPGKSLQDEMGFEEKHGDINVEEKYGEEDEDEEEYLIIEKEEVDPVMKDSLQDQESFEISGPNEKDNEEEGELKKHFRDEGESEKEKKHAEEKEKTVVNGLQGDKVIEALKTYFVPDEKEQLDDSFLAKNEVDSVGTTKDGSEVAKQTEEKKYDENKKIEVSVDHAKIIDVNLDKEKVEQFPPETKEQIQEEVQEIISSAKEIVSSKLENEKNQDDLQVKPKDTVENSTVDDKKEIESDEQKEISSISPEEKLDNSSEKNREITDETRDSDQKLLDEEHDDGVEIKGTGLRDMVDQKYPAEESQPDEKFSTTVESGATTAPTLPEDERIPLDEIKEIIEEKHVKEETKEDKPTTISAPRLEQPTTLPQVIIPSNIGVFDTRGPQAIAHQRDIVKTPDEVADLPVHEEVDPGMYEGDEFNREFPKSKDDTLFVKKHTEIEDRQSPELEVKGKLSDEDKKESHDDIENAEQIGAVSALELNQSDQKENKDYIDKKNIATSVEVDTNKIDTAVDEKMSNKKEYFSQDTVLQLKSESDKTKDERATDKMDGLEQMKHAEAESNATSLDTIGIMGLDNKDLEEKMLAKDKLDLLQDVNASNYEITGAIYQETEKEDKGIEKEEYEKSVVGVFDTKFESEEKKIAEDLTQKENFVETLEVEEKRPKEDAKTVKTTEDLRHTSDSPEDGQAIDNLESTSMKEVKISKDEIKDITNQFIEMERNVLEACVDTKTGDTLETYAIEKLVTEPESEKTDIEKPEPLGDFLEKTEFVKSTHVDDEASKKVGQDDTPGATISNENKCEEDIKSKPELSTQPLEFTHLHYAEKVDEDQLDNEQESKDKTELVKTDRDIQIDSTKQKTDDMIPEKAVMIEDTNHIEEKHKPLENDESDKLELETIEIKDGDFIQETVSEIIKTKEEQAKSPTDIHEHTEETKSEDVSKTFKSKSITEPQEETISKLVKLEPSSKPFGETILKDDKHQTCIDTKDETSLETDELKLSSELKNKDLEDDKPVHIGDAISIQFNDKYNEKQILEDSLQDSPVKDITLRPDIDKTIEKETLVKDSLLSKSKEILTDDINNISQTNEMLDEVKEKEEIPCAISATYLEIIEKLQQDQSSSEITQKLDEQVANIASDSHIISDVKKETNEIEEAILEKAIAIKDEYTNEKPIMNEHTNVINLDKFTKEPLGNEGETLIKSNKTFEPTLVEEKTLGAEDFDINLKIGLAAEIKPSNEAVELSPGNKTKLNEFKGFHIESERGEHDVDDDLGKDYEGDIEEEEEDDYVGSEYIDSGLEEEPVYGKLAAAALPEYVTVTPDSAPPSPGDYKFLERKEDRAKDVDSTNRVDRSLQQEQMERSKCINKQIPHLDKETKQMEEIKSKSPASLDKISPMLTGELNGDISPPKTPFENAVELDISLSPTKHILEDKLGSGTFTAASTHHIQEIRPDSGVSSPQSVESGKVKDVVIESGNITLSSEKTQGTELKLEALSPKQTEQDKLTDELTLGSGASTPDSKKLGEPSDEEKHESRTSTPKSIDKLTHEVKLDSRTSTPDSKKLGEPSDEDKYETRTSTPKSIDKLTHEVKLDSRTSTPDSKKLDEDKHESRTSTPKSTDKLTHEVKLDSRTSTPSSIKLGDPSDEDKHESRTSTPKSIDKLTHEVKLEYQTSTPGSIKLGEPSDEDKHESRTSTPKSTDKLTHEVKLDSRTPTPSSIKLGEPSDEDKHESRTSTPKSIDKLSHEVKLDSRTSTPSSIKLGEPSDEDKYESKTSSPKSIDKLTHEVILDSRTSTPGSTKLGEPSDEDKHESRISTPKSTDKLTHEVILDSRTSTPGSTKLGEPSDEDKHESRTSTPKSIDKLTHEVKLESGTSTPKSIGKLAQEVKLESGKSTPRSIKLEEHVKDVKLESRSSTPESIDHIKVTQEIMSESRTSTPRSIHPGDHITEHKSGTSTPRSTDIDNLTNNAKLESRTSTPRSDNSREVRHESDIYTNKATDLVKASFEERLDSGTSTPKSIDLAEHLKDVKFESGTSTPRSTESRETDFTHHELGEASFLDDLDRLRKTSVDISKLSTKVEEILTKAEGKLEEMVNVEGLLGDKEVHTKEPSTKSDFDDTITTCVEETLKANAVEKITEVDLKLSQLVDDETSHMETSSTQQKSEKSEYDSEGKVVVFQNEEMALPLEVVEAQETIVSESETMDPKQKSILEKSEITSDEQIADTSAKAIAPKLTEGKLTPIDIVTETLLPTDLHETKTPERKSSGVSDSDTSDITSTIAAVPDIGGKLEEKDIIAHESDGVVSTEHTTHVETSSSLDIDHQDAPNATTVRRMVVTASSEDGGVETEVCESGSITYTSKPETETFVSTSSHDQDHSRSNSSSPEQTASEHPSSSIQVELHTKTQHEHEQTHKDYVEEKTDLGYTVEKSPETNGHVYSSDKYDNEDIIYEDDNNSVGKAISTKTLAQRDYDSDEDIVQDYVTRNIYGGRNYIMSPMKAIRTTHITVTKTLSDESDDIQSLSQKSDIYDSHEDVSGPPNTFQTTTTYMKSIKNLEDEDADVRYSSQESVASGTIPESSKASTATTKTYTTVLKSLEDGEEAYKKVQADTTVTKPSPSKTITTVTKTISGDDEIKTVNITKEISLGDEVGHTVVTKTTYEDGEIVEQQSETKNEYDQPYEHDKSVLRLESTQAHKEDISSANSNEGKVTPLDISAVEKVISEISGVDSSLINLKDKDEHVNTVVEVKTVIKDKDGVTETVVTKTTKETRDLEEPVGKGDSTTSITINKESSDIVRSGTPGSDELSDRELAFGGPLTLHSDVRSGQASRAPTHIWGESSEGRPDSDEDEDGERAGSPLSISSQLAHSPLQYEHEISEPQVLYIKTKSSSDLMMESFHDENYVEEVDLQKKCSNFAMTSSIYGNLPPEPPKQPLEEHTTTHLTEDKDTTSTETTASSFAAGFGKDKTGTTTKTTTTTYKYFTPGDKDPNNEETLDFERALREHRLTRGEDLAPITSTVSYHIETKSSPSHTYKYEHSSTGLNGHKHADDFEVITASKSHKDLANKNLEVNGKHNGNRETSILTSDDKMSSSFHQEILTSSKDVMKEDITTSSIEHDPMFHHQFASSSALTSGQALPEPPHGFDLATTGKPDGKKDPIESWGKPLGLPAPAPPPTKDTNTSGEIVAQTNKGTPKKEKKTMQMKKTIIMNENNKANSATKEVISKKRPESPVKQAERKGSSTNKDTARNAKLPGSPIYVDLTYVPHHGNSYYTSVEFFKKVRARYYVFSGTDPSREVYNALLEAKQTWEDKELEVTIIPTYDTDTLGYWVAENEDILAKCKIDLSPSASRCTINLQDHETSCSAYRLEF